MMTIGNLTVTDKMFKLVDGNVNVHPCKPMAFYITDYNGKYFRESNRLNEIKKWVEKLGAEVKQIEDYCTHVAFEISDPICGQLERFFKDTNRYREF